MKATHPVKLLQKPTREHTPLGPVFTDNGTDPSAERGIKCFLHLNISISHRDASFTIIQIKNNYERL